jgi:uncharacterized membrane protein
MAHGLRSLAHSRRNAGFFMPRTRTFRTFRAISRAATLSTSLTLAACHGGGDERWGAPGNRADTQPFADIGPGETIHVVGTEPFWSGDIAGGAILYKTPGSPDGETIAVSRFAGRGGVSFSGEYDGRTFTLAVTPGECSDGMSDRAYPFVATLLIAEESRTGCAWSDKHPFTGPTAP